MNNLRAKTIAEKGLIFLGKDEVVGSIPTNGSIALKVLSGNNAHCLRWCHIVQQKFGSIFPFLLTRSIS
jgi:hypothetical protein